MRMHLYGWRRAAGIALWILGALAGLLLVGVALTPFLLVLLPFLAVAAPVVGLIAFGFWRGNPIARWAGLVLGLGILGLAAQAVPGMLPCPPGYVEQYVHECMRFSSPVVWAIWVLAVLAGGTVVVGSLLPGVRAAGGAVDHAPRAGSANG